MQERRYFADLCVFTPSGRFASRCLKRDFARVVKVALRTLHFTHHKKPTPHAQPPTTPLHTPSHNNCTVERPCCVLVAGQVHAINAGVRRYPGGGRALLDETRMVVCVVFVAVTTTCSAGRGRGGSRCRSAEGQLTLRCVCGLWTVRNVEVSVCPSSRYYELSTERSYSL